MYYIVLASLAGLIALIVSLLSIKFDIKGTRYIIALSSGIVISTAFLDIIPEAQIKATGLVLAAGFFAFYLIEKLIMIHSCGEEECEVHHLSSVSVVGMALDNFVDGIGITIAYLASPSLGVVLTLAVIAHEIPQDITAAAIMKNLKYSRNRMLLPVVLGAVLYPMGGITGLYIPSEFHKSVLAFVAGALIYIGVGDLLAESHRKFNLKVVAAVILGFLFIAGLGFLGIKA